MEAGVVRPGEPKLLCFTTLRASMGVASWYRDHGPWEPEWIINEVTDFILRGLLLRPPAPSESR